MTTFHQVEEYILRYRYEMSSQEILWLVDMLLQPLGGCDECEPERGRVEIEEAMEEG